MSGPDVRHIDEVPFAACRLWQYEQAFLGGQLTCVSSAEHCTTHGWHAFHAIVPGFLAAPLAALGAMPADADRTTIPPGSPADLKERVAVWVTGLHHGGGRNARN